MLDLVMRLIAKSNVRSFWEEHPEARTPLERWVTAIEDGDWSTTAEIQASFPKAKVLNRERIRFEIGGGDFRLIASFKFVNRIAFVKFIGTHAAYDRVDALTVSLY